MTDTPTMEVILLVAAFILLAVLAPLFGADSRRLDRGFRD